jgi:hypothetical protein
MRLRYHGRQGQKGEKDADLVLSRNILFETISNSVQPLHFFGKSVMIWPISRRITLA